MRKAARSIPSSLNRALLFVAVSEGILLLALVTWLGYLHLALARLVQPSLAWAVRLAGIVVVSTAVWQFYRFARRRRFRFSLRTLLVSTCILGALLGLVGRYLTQLNEQQAANRAVLHIMARSSDFIVGPPKDAPPGAPSNWTDSRYAVEVSFTGTVLEEADFAQLARIPGLVSITIKNTPIREQGFLLLRRLPNLQFLVLENTGSSDAILERIGKMHPNWHVFRSWEELKQWSLARVRMRKSNGEL